MDVEVGVVGASMGVKFELEEVGVVESGVVVVWVVGVVFVVVGVFVVDIDVVGERWAAGAGSRLVLATAKRRLP